MGEPSKSRLWLVVIGAVLAVVIVVSTGVAAAGATKTLISALLPLVAQRSEQPFIPVQPTTTVLRPALDGDFKFTVGHFETVHMWAFATVLVTNIGNEAHAFLPRYQHLVDDRGRTFDIDTEKSAQDNNVLPGNLLNPGMDSSFKLSYRIKPGTKFSAVELHESPNSVGVRILVG